jgi:hypothetical protein
MSTIPSHLPRFHRAADSIWAMQLTPRDVEIIRIVDEHRFIRSNQIISLAGGSPQQLLRRLQLLFHHGYLDRPRSQLSYFHEGGSKSIAYGLGNKGAKLLANVSLQRRPRFDWTDRNQSVKQFYLQHSLLISEVMVAMEKSCVRSEHIRLIREDELTARINLRDPFRWTVDTGSYRLGLRPDKVFGLENTRTGDRAFYFLEADRATMPVVRQSLSQSSFQRKLLAYEATWNQNVHRSRFNFNRFRVLTVTSSPARVKHLVEACAQLKRGHGLFLFADADSFSRHADPLSFRWHTAQAGKTASLFA